MALAPLPARLSSAKLELDRLNSEVNKFTVDTINHLKSLRSLVASEDAAIRTELAVGLAAEQERIRARHLSSGQNTNAAALADVSAELVFPLQAGATYSFTYSIQYDTASAVTGLLLAVNYTGSVSSIIYTLMGANGAATFQSAVAGALDTPLGTAAVGPGAGNVATQVFGTIITSGAGDLVLRYASGVAGNNVMVGGGTFAVCIEQ